MGGLATLAALASRTHGFEEVGTRIDELDKNAPTVVFCAGGYRSAIASSLLRSHGFTDVSDIIGGYTAWSAAQHELPAGAR